MLMAGMTTLVRFNVKLWKIILLILLSQKVTHNKALLSPLARMGRLTLRFSRPTDLNVVARQVGAVPIVALAHARYLEAMAHLNIALVAQKAVNTRATLHVDRGGD